MNLSSIPDEVWQKLAQAAIQAAEKKLSVKGYVRNYFYKHIYSTFSKAQTSYTPNLEDEVDAGWEQLAVEWEKIAATKAPIGKQLGDDSVGKAKVQGSTAPDQVSKVRLWEKYNDKGRGDRFQFVVSMGGGMVLFNRMRRACQTYILEKLGGKAESFVVRGWKVFGEAGGEGRSDSCVVYLGCKYTDPTLATVVNSNIWPNIKDLVDPDFKPLGFYSIDNKPLWAMPMPSADKERAVLGEVGGGSAGGLMGQILGLAFERAGPKADSNAAALVTKAKEQAAEIVTQLY